MRQEFSKQEKNSQNRRKALTKEQSKSPCCERKVRNQ